MPFFLKFWGSNLYGEWLVLTGLPTMLALLDAGVTQASTNRGTIEAASGNKYKVKAILQTSLAFSTIVGALIVALVGFSVFIINWSEVLNLEEITRSQASKVIVCMAVYLAIQLQGGVTDACFKFIDKAPLGVFLLANRRVFDLIVVAVVLSLGGNPIFLAVSLASGQILLLVILRLLASRLAGEKVFRFTLASKKEFRAIFKPAIGYLGFPLAQATTLQGGIQVLNLVAGANTVVAFTMCRTLTRMVIQLAVITNNALKPELSRLAGEGKFEELEDLSSKVSIWTNVVSMICYLFLVTFGPTILSIWSKGVVDISSGFVALIGLHAILNVMWFVKSAAKTAQNKHNKIALIYCMSSILFLLIWISTKSIMLPVVGAALLLAFPEVIMNLHRIMGKVRGDNL
ncbi:lipopolysaccharide biosynthesis protein [Luteolibacter algae]|uniref:Lipopolysaccharide biosynthesis protein n=1 Tax=Luteolibacter algae TaxID=454151 RepID=A0ABW5D4X7_9BACT